MFKLCRWSTQLHLQATERPSLILLLFILLLIIITLHALVATERSVELRTWLTVPRLLSLAAPSPQQNAGPQGLFPPERRLVVAVVSARGRSSNLAVRVRGSPPGRLSTYGRLRRLGNAPQTAGECTTVDGASAIQDRKQSCKPANVCGPNSFDALCKCHKQTRSLRRWA